MEKEDDHILPAPEGSTNNDVKPRRIWMRYRTELCHRHTGEVIHSVDSEEPKPVNLVEADKEPIFELVTKYIARGLNSGPEKSKAHASVFTPAVDSAPSYSLRIYSSAIINALQSVVEYYPSQDLSGTVVVVKWPYPILAHHYTKLRDFKTKCETKRPEDLCEREMGASEHIDLLLGFLDDNIMDRVKAEEERIERGYYTFADTWVSYKPGRTIVELDKQHQWRPYVVTSISGGIFQNPPVGWTISGWRLEFDGDYLGRARYNMTIDPFDGESKWHDSTRFIDDWDTIEGDELEKLIADGKKYWNLVKKQCKHHKGKTVEFPYNMIDGLVMTDMESYYAKYPPSRPSLLEDTDFRRWVSDCSCSVCKQRALHGGGNVASIFEDYTNKTHEEWEDLTRHMYLLCPGHIPAYVFKLRKWEDLHVANLEEPVFQENMVDNLVMEPSRMRTLKALASSYIRVNQHGKPIEHDPWAADFVKGKGSGLIFLLHGKPGVGKTATAESVAEFTRRPLMSLTSSDIGTDPKLVESNLTRDFMTARSWGAVLLIDEADVFMERRSSQDLQRNSLVAGFLRALEFYDGILFLTTNRVGAFDDAFISRIHVQLLYREFTEEERQKVWMTFVKKLTKERGKYIRISLDAKEYISGKEVQAVKWNGREIRNAFQTAVSLAEYEDERDDEGKILLTDEHLRSVVRLSKDFKTYLEELHKADEDKRAKKRFERLDT
ncbi:Protein MSP1 [Cytospora mali]|uniref:Protein MSP1 n=1 Tax=Cytospora mali TaxID=578113 RepID=A0A194UNZ2_CYTMA|nr:Protein MSP1 [Valsa mali var. pyri (nom. inval.)]